ncbi:tyrosine-type recombinase/integrase [Schinkia azotoformans]|uniref:tyrosine-type recombinase/integrase n=1 Tax=Schinkia azotoformans TaxID=1454 RepID=UPI002DB829F9|nr:tyrosine-type recombinase/integrase [Schinkia azotoformans]MEC1715937.1 tyrosine-type recombinase/integrase [Schinkia azotoformans]MEC1740110.1 tyrosine-type recombinase/integrase [Schinkia azotoformans]MEC1744570.1 tyrosine-type recombinase/integrase [Schinkia azotoformans]MEC1756278.1 tyrosine-type recombinase/integrase [Schinkia azotoformans]MEC1769149.1 tyrosine-type recombinase/integrase [Schinkia azotoformans]
MLIELAQKEFFAEKKFEGLTDNSLDCYVVFFKTWNEWLVENNIEQLEDLTPRVTKRFLTYCQEERDNKPTSINSKLKMLRTFSKWCVQEKLIPESFTENIKSMKQDTQPKMVKDSDIQMALRHLRRVKRRENTFEARRNYTILVYLIGTGMRLGEVERLAWDDIDFENYLIIIRTSKSRKSQSIPLSESLAKELLEWKHFCEHKFSKFPESVFVTRTGKGISSNSIQLVFQRLKKNLGIEGDFSPHCMRNVYIKNLLKNGANMRQVQLLARHSKIEVTRQYVGYFAHELKDAIDEFNPLRDLL